MDFRCEVCNFEAKSAASLGSHKHYKHGIQAKVSGFDEGLVKRLEAVAEKLESKVQPCLYTCPDCGSILAPHRDSKAGLFHLKCPKCY